MAGWCTVMTTDDEVQVYPLGDLVSHDLVEDRCVCVPRAQCIHREGEGDAWMYVHHALDQRD